MKLSRPKEARRNFRTIGGGRQTGVLRHDRVDHHERIIRPGKSVVKIYESDFDNELKTKLDKRYKLLRQFYGDFIPRQHIVQRPDSPAHYALVQEKIETADPADIFQYEADTLPVPEKTIPQLRRLAQLLLENYQRFRKDKAATDQYALMDFFGRGNVLLSASGDVKYIDTGIFDFTEIDDELCMDATLSAAASLEIIAGRPPLEVWNDPAFTELKEYVEKNAVPEFGVDPAGDRSTPYSFAWYLNVVH